MLFFGHFIVIGLFSYEFITYKCYLSIRTPVTGNTKLSELPLNIYSVQCGAENKENITFTGPSYMPSTAQPPIMSSMMNEFEWQ